jgi:hypothetical protein
MSRGSHEGVAAQTRWRPESRSSNARWSFADCTADFTKPPVSALDQRGSDAAGIAMERYRVHLGTVQRVRMRIPWNSRQSSRLVDPYKRVS